MIDFAPFNPGSEFLAGCGVASSSGNPHVPTCTLRFPTSSRLAPERTSNPVKILGRVDVSFPTTSQTLESQRCQGFKNYPQCTSSTPPVIFETLPSCDFQVFVSRYENETSTRPKVFQKISDLGLIFRLGQRLL